MVEAVEVSAVMEQMLEAEAEAAQEVQAHLALVQRKVLEGTQQYKVLRKEIVWEVEGLMVARPLIRSVLNLEAVVAVPQKLATTPSAQVHLYSEQVVEVAEGH
jgi:hypothetical protein